MTPPVSRRCPYCGEETEAETFMPDGPGDTVTPDSQKIAICAYCREINVLEDGGLRRPTSAELAEFMGNFDLWRKLQYLRAKLKEFNEQQRR